MAKYIFFDTATKLATYIDNSSDTVSYTSGNIYNTNYIAVLAPVETLNLTDATILSTWHWTGAGLVLGTHEPKPDIFFLWNSSTYTWTESIPVPVVDVDIPNVDGYEITLTWSIIEPTWSSTVSFPVKVWAGTTDDVTAATLVTSTYSHTFTYTTDSDTYFWLEATWDKGFSTGVNTATGIVTPDSPLGVNSYVFYDTTTGLVDHIAHPLYNGQYVDGTIYDLTSLAKSIDLTETTTEDAIIKTWHWTGTAKGVHVADPGDFYLWDIATFSYIYSSPNAAVILDSSTAGYRYIDLAWTSTADVPWQGESFAYEISIVSDFSTILATTYASNYRHENTNPTSRTYYIRAAWVGGITAYKGASVNTGSLTPLAVAGTDLATGAVNTQIAGSGVNVMNPRYCTFEEAALPPIANNSNVTPCTFALDTSTYVFGTKSLKITKTVQATDDAVHLNSSSSAARNITLSAGKKWIVSLFFKASVANFTFNADILYGIGGYNVVPTLTGVTKTFTNGTDLGWIRGSYVIDARTGASSTETAFAMTIDLLDTVTGTLNIDGIMIEEQVGNLTTPSAYHEPPNFLTTFLGSLDATKNIIYRKDGPDGPTGGTYSLGDLWIDTRAETATLSPGIYQRNDAISGVNAVNTVWQLVSNKVSDTAQLVDTKGFGLATGGTNMLDYSGNFASTAGWTVHNANATLTYDATVPYAGYGSLKISGGASTDRGAYTNAIARLKANTTYIVSAMVKGSVAWDAAYDATLHVQCWTDEAPANLHQDVGVAGTKSITTGWTVISQVFKTPVSAAACHCRLYFYNFTGTLNIAYVQLEEGNKASAWSPSIGDVNRGIDLAGDTALWSGTNITGKPTDPELLNLSLLKSIDNNLIADSGLTLPAWWGMGSGSAWPTNLTANDGALTGGQTKRFFRSYGSGTYFSMYFPIKAGRQYRIVTKIFISTTMNGYFTLGLVEDNIAFRIPGATSAMPTGTPLATVPAHTAASFGANAWKTSEQTFTATNSSIRVAYGDWFSAGYVESYISLTEVAETNDIQDNAVTNSVASEFAVTDVTVPTGTITNTVLDGSLVSLPASSVQRRLLFTVDMLVQPSINSTAKTVWRLSLRSSTDNITFYEMNFWVQVVQPDTTGNYVDLIFLDYIDTTNRYFKLEVTQNSGSDKIVSYGQILVVELKK